jgi:hypothetical protein
VIFPHEKTLGRSEKAQGLCGWWKERTGIQERERAGVFTHIIVTILPFSGG